MSRKGTFAVTRDVSGKYVHFTREIFFILVSHGEFCVLLARRQSEDKRKCDVLRANEVLRVSAVKAPQIQAEWDGRGSPSSVVFFKHIYVASLTRERITKARRFDFENSFSARIIMYCRTMRSRTEINTREITVADDVLTERSRAPRNRTINFVLDRSPRYGEIYVRQTNEVHCLSL